MAGATGIDTKLALGLLRTEIGHVLIPIAHPTIIIFNIVAALAFSRRMCQVMLFRLA